MGTSLIFEGNEGAGKTTLASMSRLLIEATTSFPVLFVREPGGTLEADLIRTLLKSEHGKNMHPNTNMLLFTAARNELLENRIKPFINENPDGIIIGDRGWPSTLALQLAEGAEGGYVERVQEPFMNAYPDKVFLVDVPVEESLVRLEGVRLYGYNREMDWRDNEEANVLGLYRDNYLRLVNRFPNIIVVDGFEDPWRVAWSARQTVLGKLAHEMDREIRRKAESDFNNFDHKSLSEFSQKAYDEGITVIREGVTVTERVDIESMHQRTEAARELLGARSRDDLRDMMYATWETMGIEHRYRRNKER